MSHACKHKPDSHIMPYWSDRVRRKLAENTNTAWGGSLKLETSLLSMVFSSSGNHLVAHAYQVLLSPSLRLHSAFFRLWCLLQYLWDGAFQKKMQTNLPAIWLFSQGCSAATNTARSTSNHFFVFNTCLGIRMPRCNMARLLWQDVYRCRHKFILKAFSSRTNSHFFPPQQQSLQSAQILSKFPVLLSNTVELSQGSHLQ